MVREGMKRRLPMMEQQLADVFPWAKWFWMCGLGIAVILAFYVVAELVKIVRRD
jgi:hypothetical protein